MADEVWTVHGISVECFARATALLDATPEQVTEIVEVFNANEEATMMTAVDEVLGTVVE